MKTNQTWNEFQKAHLSTQRGSFPVDLNGGKDFGADGRSMLLPQSQATGTAAQRAVYEHLYEGILLTLSEVARPTVHNQTGTPGSIQAMLHLRAWSATCAMP